MSEPLCQCGHGKRQHASCKWECYYCQCAEFAPRKRETESGGRIDTFDDPYANARTEAPPARSRDDAENAITVEFTDEQLDRLGHWLSECLDDAAPLNERVWRNRAEWMVKGPTFQSVVADLITDGRNDA